MLAMRRVLLIGLTASLLVISAACGSSSTKSTPVAPTNLRGRAQVDVDAKSYQFTPNDIVVDVGTKVTWHNTDSVAHNVKKSADALDFGAPFGTNNLNPGQSYSFTFTKVGTFPYVCTIHAGMTGKVEVVAK